jgi:hypothetical protein
MSYLKITSLAVILMASSPVMAQMTNMPPGGQPPSHEQQREKMAEVSRDLGVSPQQLHACREMRQKPLSGQHLTREQREANKVTVENCLKQANPTLTDEKIESVLRSARKR